MYGTLIYIYQYTIGIYRIYYIIFILRNGCHFIKKHILYRKKRRHEGEQILSKYIGKVIKKKT